MILALGIVIGLLIYQALFVMEIYFKKTLLNRIERKVQSMLPKEKGAIISLPTEEDRAISEIIQKNQEKGADTFIDELQ